MKWRPYLSFLLSLSQGHMKQKNGGRWVATRFGRNLVCHNPTRIGANTKAKKKKEKKKWHGCVSAALPRQCVSGAGEVAPTTILHNKTFHEFRFSMAFPTNISLIGNLWAWSSEDYDREHVEKKEKMASVPTKSFRYKFWSLKISNFLKWKIIIHNRNLNIRLPITYYKI